MTRRSIFIAFTLLAIPVFVLAAAEILLALAGYETTYEQEDPFLGFQNTVSLFQLDRRDSNGASIHVTRPAKLRWFNRQEFSLPKPDYGYRIFSFGGSTTFGRPYDHKTSFSNWLNILLQRIAPGREIEVINAGGVSYASYRIVNLMQEMVDYQPDAFIVYTGHNEFLEERTYGDLKDQSQFAAALRARLNQLRSYSLLRSLWLKRQADAAEAAEQKYQMTGEVQAILDQSLGLDRYHRDPEQASAILEHFRLNLDRMVDLAHQHGIELIFVVPPSNEKDFSPFKSEHSPALDAAQLRRWTEFYQSGRESLQRQSFDAACESFASAKEVDSSYADLRFRLGQCLLALDRPELAKTEFVAALNLDVAPLRASSRIQSIIRQTAAERKVPVVDLVTILENDCAQRWGHRILGEEYLLDHAHPTIAVHQLAAEQLAAAILREQWLRPTIELTSIDKSTLYDSVLATVDSAYFAMRELNLAKVLSWAGKNEEAQAFVAKAAQSLPEHPETHYLSGLAAQDSGNFAAALQHYNRAVEVDSSFAKALNGIGTIYEKTDQLPAALQYFDAAIRARPDYDNAYYNRGNALYRMGRLQEAVGAFQTALELNPYHSKALNNLGGIYMMKNQIHDAMPAFLKTLELDPNNISAYSNLGVIYHQIGNLDKARTMFNKVLEIAPDDQYAMKWLAKINQE